MKLVIQFLLMPLPWALRCRALNRLFGFEIAHSARIGYSLIAAKQVTIGEGARIGHLNFIRNLASLRIEPYVIIGNMNWISGTGPNHPVHYRDHPARDPSLTMRRHASISSRHHLDCTDRIEIGEFTVVGGAATQILTHGIDVRSSRQLAGPVSIGAYCFVGSRSLFLRDSALPDHSVLAAGAVVARKLEGSFRLFGGGPAREIGALPEDALFFSRELGFVA